MLQYYWKQLNDRCSGYLVTRVVVQMLGDLSGNKLTNCVTPREKCVTLCILTHSLKLTQGASYYHSSLLWPLSWTFSVSNFWLLAMQTCFCVLQAIKIWSKGRQSYWLLEGPLTNLLSSGDVLLIQLCTTWHTCELKKLVPAFPFRICPKLREKSRIDSQSLIEAIEK